MTSGHPPGNPQTPSAPFLLVAAIAVAIGIYARFKGLGFAPIAIDEYYLSRAIDGILKSGLPIFDCGGYYQRGALLQYLAAGLRVAGLSPELAPRALAAVASVIALPAVFLVGRRFLTPNAALVAVSIMAVSLWEIEMARFGRFYSPFIALFTWYLVYFLRYTVDRDRRAWAGMLVLTLIGALVWEGAIFLALANLFPVLLNFSETGRLEKQDWRDAAIAMAVCMAIYAMAAINLRTSSAIAAFPPGYSPDLVDYPSRKLDLIKISLTDILKQPVWTLLFFVITIVSGIALRWIWQWRTKPLAMLGLLTMLGAALLHQFAIVLAVPVVLLLLNQISMAELRKRRAGLFIATLLSIAAMWIAYGLATTDWQLLRAGTDNLPQTIAVFAFQYFSYPTLLTDVVSPFAKAVPVFGALMLGGLAIALIRELKRTRELRSAERIAVLLLVLVLLAVGFADPPREETRYVVFLHPLLVLVSVAAISYLVKLMPIQERFAQWAIAALAFTAFAVTEDFNPRHILTIDSPESTFRRGMSLKMQAHLGEARDDFRSIAAWLQTHASPEHDIVVNAVHGVDYYFADTRYFFAESNSPTFLEWSCREGTVDRWTNLPLIYSIANLKARTASAETTYLITWTLDVDRLLPLLADRHARLAFVEGSTAVVAMDRGQDRS